MGEASQQRVLATFLALNTKIAAELGEHFQIGHSYFMHSDIDTDERLEQVWRHAILPLLEEYYHGRRDIRQGAVSCRQPTSGTDELWLLLEKLSTSWRKCIGTMHYHPQRVRSRRLRRRRPAR